MKCILKDIVDIISGGTPKTSVSDYWGGNIPWISIKDFNFGNVYINQTEKSITQTGLNNSSTNILKKNDIIISARGTVGCLAIINRKMAFNQSCYGIRVKNEIQINPKYLYWYLKNIMNELKTKTHGSVFDTIIKTDLENLKVNIPDIKVQNIVATIIDNITKKIMCNNEINNNLHELCNNMYFELVSQLDDSNSSSKQIKEVSKCVLGGTPSRSKSEYWNGNTNWINSGEVNKFRIIDASEKITELGLQKSSTSLLPKNTTVLAITGATLGQVSRLEIDSCANQSVIGIIPNSWKLNNYLYLSILNTINDLVLKQTGGAQQHINKNDVETHEIIIPNDNLLKDFDEKVSPIFNKISLNCFENRKLEELRDILLPKLMNGEIDLDNIKI